MKLKNLFTSLLTVLAISVFISCEDNSTKTENESNSIIPEKFKVDIPSSLSKEYKSAEFKSTEGDTMQGDEIYGLLKLFIAVGEGSADIVQAIMVAIKTYNIENVTDITFISDEDARTKHLTVSTDAEFNGVVWEYMLTITDLLSEPNTDGGIGMQVFWSNNPVEGIAIFKPYNNNRESDANSGEAMYRIEYSAKKNDNYDEYMLVEIANLPLSSDQYSINNLKMYVGKKGNVVDVYGNSNHPNAQFNTYDGDAKGFNWAFVASSDEIKNIAIAELGLPASDATISTRKEILKDNAMKIVFSREITNAILTEHPEYDSAAVAAYIEPFLSNTEAPGYFNSAGFIQAASSPGTEYDAIKTRILNLKPFVPAEVSALSINFSR